VLRGPENRGPVGAEFETPNFEWGGQWGGGIPLSSRLGGLRERRKLPQWGPGRSPGRKQILVHFALEKTNLVMTNLILFVIFIAHIYSQIYKAIFDIYFFSFAGGLRQWSLDIFSRQMFASVAG